MSLKTILTATLVSSCLFLSLHATCAASASEYPLASSIAALKTTLPITIDGKLLESPWRIAKYVELSSSATNGNQVKIYSLWDEKNLYFAYDVTDTTLEANGTVYYPYSRDDGAGIYLDTKNNKSTTRDSDDYVCTININDLIKLNNTTVSSIKSKTVRKTNGYTMEIAIPWTAINTTPAAYKSTIGLLLANNDSDSGNISRLFWPVQTTGGSYNQPNLWGNILLYDRLVLMWQVSPDVADVINGQLKIMKNKGVNLVQSFSITKWSDEDIAKFLECMKDNDIGVIMTIAPFLIRGAELSWDYVKTTDFVNKWKDYPKGRSPVFAWHLFDEPSNENCPIPISFQEEVCRFVKGLDPDHKISLSWNGIQDNAQVDHYKYFSDKLFDMVDLHYYGNGYPGTGQQNLLDSFKRHRTREYPITITISAHDHYINKDTPDEYLNMLPADSIQQQYDFFFKQNNLTYNIGFYGWKLNPNIGINNTEPEAADLMRQFKELDMNIYPDATPPTPPAEVKDEGDYTNNYAQLYCSWKGASDPETGIASYDYWIKDYPQGGTGNVIRHRTSVGTNLYVTAGGLNLVEGKKYYFNLRATNGIGLVSGIAYSDGITTRLKVPTSLTATALTGRQIKLTWIDNSSAETGYEVERKIGSAGTYSKIATLGVNATTYTNSGLTTNTTYYYRIRAYKTGGIYSSYSTVVSATAKN